MVPTFKQTSDPIEEVFQMQNDNIITETDYSYIHSEPLDVYSRQILYDENIQDTVYGTDEEFNTLFYDIEQSSDTEASEQQVSDQASISKSLFLHLCAHSKIHSQCVLLKLMVRLRECGSKLYSNLIPKLIPTLLWICQHILKPLLFILFTQQLYMQLIFIQTQI